MRNTSFSSWKRVEDIAPPENVEILLYTEEGKIYIGMRQFQWIDEEGQEWFTSSDDDFDGGVLFWDHLPQAPTGVYLPLREYQELRHNRQHEY